MMDDDSPRWVADGFGQLQLQIVELAARVDELEAALPPATVPAGAESQTVPTFSVTPTCKCLALGRPTNPMIWFLGPVVPEIHCSNCSTLWAYVLVEP